MSENENLELLTKMFNLEMSLSSCKSILNGTIATKEYKEHTISSLEYIIDGYQKFQENMNSFHHQQVEK